MRETWGYFGGDEYLYLRERASVGYRSNYICGHVPGGRWRPSIHMPRWASRLTLEVTGVGIERLQEISTKDAIAEGVEYDVSEPAGDPVSRFEKLWDSINKSRAPWASNPWVWVVQFRRLE